MSSSLAASSLAVVGLVGFSGATSGSVETTNAIESVISHYEDANLAVFSPLATSSSNNAQCSSIGCSPSVTAATDASTAQTQFTDVASADPSKVSWTSPTAQSSVSNSALIQARNQSAFEGLATSGTYERVLAAATRFFQDETSVLSGNYASCNVSYACTVTAAAGASVVSMTNPVITGTTASVSAVVKGWQQMASVNASGMIGNWHIAEGELNVDYQLSLLSDGAWTITSRVGNFVPGQQP